MPPTPPRILVYCHNVHGLGHIVRSLRIAAALGPGEHCACRLITGCRFLDRLTVDPRIEVVRLPALQPAPNGRLATLDGSPVGRTLRERSRAIAAEIASWRPHAVLVDHNPLGLVGEMAYALETHGGSTRFVWGMRDIWGDPAVLDRLDRYGGGPAVAASRMHHYHSAIAYSDAGWLDTFASYPNLPLPARRASVGFVTAPPRPAAASPVEPPVETGAPLPPLITALSGGGSRAGALLELLLAALAGPLGRGELRLRFIVGPFTPAEEMRARAAAHPGVDLWAEASAEEALAGASLVVSRTGYNSAYSVVQTALPVVFVPIQAEDREQDWRAARLAELPAVFRVDEAGADPAAALAEAVRRGLAARPVERTLPFSTAGARGAADWLLAVAREAA